MKIPITQVPQADELSKVIATVEAVYNNYKDDQGIADYVGFTDRQGRYYRLAAEILGLLINENNNAELTDAGSDFIVLDDDNRKRRIRNILRYNNLFKLILLYIESSEEGLSRLQIINYLVELIDGAESTVVRRYSTIIRWLLSSELVKLDIREQTDGEETVYKINDQLDEEKEEADNISDSNGNEDSNPIDSIYPATYTNAELDIKESHMQVISLVRKKQQGKIVVPEFQRKLVWKPQQKSRFIESLILNIPVPPFYVSQDLEGTMIIVDGLQRSTAIFEFLSNKYALVGLEALPYLNEKSYADLNGELDSLKARIEDRDLLLYILKPSVPMPVVYDIFNRINSNGTPLTRQEIRNCIYIGKSTKLLQELVETSQFKEAINNGIPTLRMKDREAVLRFFAFSSPNAPADYKGDLDEFLGKAMRRINRMSDDEIERLKQRFLRVMELTRDFFGERNFRLPIGNSRGRINIALLEAISVFFDQRRDSELIPYKEIITQRYWDRLLTDVEFLNSIKTATNNERNVKTRFQKVFDILTP